MPNFERAPQPEKPKGFDPDHERKIKEAALEEAKKQIAKDDITRAQDRFFRDQKKEKGF